MRLVWLGLAWLSGIVIGNMHGPSAYGWLLLVAGALVAVFLFRHHKAHRWVFILIAVISLAAAPKQSP
jgi:uncharacterized membrane protein HdeD (DUF308 family)